jgi:hypothetical protein
LVRCHGISLALKARQNAALRLDVGFKKRRTQKWLTVVNPAVVAWALALEKGLFDPMDVSHRGLKQIHQRLEYKDSQVGKPE